MRLIRVTNHSIDQVRERWPGDLPGDREQARASIANEVSAALEEQRYSTRRPRFLLRPGTKQRTIGKRNRGERDRTIRYAWTPDERRVYLIDKRGQADIVITALSPHESAERGDSLRL